MADIRDGNEYKIRKWLVLKFHGSGHLQIILHLNKITECLKMTTFKIVFTFDVFFSAETTCTARWHVFYIRNKGTFPVGKPRTDSVPPTMQSQIPKSRDVTLFFFRHDALQVSGHALLTSTPHVFLLNIFINKTERSIHFYWIHFLNKIVTWLTREYVYLWYRLLEINVGTRDTAADEML